jgi:hypothetical protein
MLELFNNATGIAIIYDKSATIYHNGPNGEIKHLQSLLLAPLQRMEEDIKYIGFLSILEDQENRSVSLSMGE